MADILIVDDEETLLATLRLELTRAGHRCHSAETGAAALAQLERVEPHLALLDIRLPDADGLELIGRFRHAGHDFPIIVMTAHGSVASAVAAMKAGAADYLQKPVSIGELEVVVDRVLRARRMQDRLDVFEREDERRGVERRIIGDSPNMREALSLAAKIATIPPDAEGHLPTVLVTGETGTGKDLLAHYVHDLGPHRAAPFVQINCTALPPQLVEAELFGYEKGAFTDAKAAKRGLFEVAAEGTVFLDEIGDTPLDLQAKLLVVLEKRTLRRLGGTSERAVKARTIAATNCDLTRLAADGRFRKDLLFRFRSLSVELPPLRARGADVCLIAEHFIRKQAARLHKPPPVLSDAARAALQRYSWPGNVRELDNVVQRAVLLAEKGTIEPADLSLTQGELAGAAAASLAEMRFPFGRESCTLSRVEERLIAQAVEHCNGNISEAARLLGVSRGALRHRMDKLSLNLQPRHL
ncbi:MAG: sigma-54 dependent transcriptional regulator [Phycisphaerae bacterium]